MLDNADLCPPASRYWWRTWLRERLPWRLLWLAPKGRDCGPERHQWYRDTDTLDACYHCRATRPSGLDLRSHPVDVLPADAEDLGDDARRPKVAGDGDAPFKGVGD